MNRLAFVCAAGAALLSSSAAVAGGLFVPGTGPQAQARAGAFVAKADDGSALFHNPAGFAKQKGTVVYIGTNLVDYNLDFTREGNYEVTDGGHDYEGSPYPTVSNDASPNLGFAGFQAVPIFAISTDFGLKAPVPFSVAIGIIAPQAFPNREFAAEVSVPGATEDAPGPQRYDTVTQKAETALPSIALAVQPIPQLDIGIRYSYGFSTLNATTNVWGIRNYEEYVEKDGVFNVSVDDNYVPAWGFGALFRPMDNLELGVSYHSKLSIEAKGTGTSVLGADLGVGGEPETIVPEDDMFANCEPGGTVDALKACVNLEIPQMATVGGRYILRDANGKQKADVELDVRWENWSSERASDYEVIVDGRSGLTGISLNKTFIKHGTKDVYSVRVGGSYTLPMQENDLTIRGGIAYDTAAVEQDFERVDFDGAARTTIGLGVGYDFMKRYRVDFGGGFVIEGTRTVEQCLPPEGPDLADLACDGTGDFTPVKERERPDPAQPLGDFNSGVESPFNGGEYKSSYLLLSLGFSAAF